MRRGLIILLMALVIATPVDAQDIRILSGEHDTFSRLVLSIGPDVDWSVTRVERGYSVEVERDGAGFDLAQAFDRIPRTRVETLEDQGNGRLFIRSTCDCHVRPTAVGTGLLAIDIVDGPAPQDALAFNQQAPATVPVADPSGATSPKVGSYTPPPVRLPLNLPGLRLPDPPLPRPEDVPAARTAPLEETTTSIRDADETPVPTEADANTPLQRARETEAALLEQIARAAAQGLLDADVPEPVQLSDRPAPSSVDEEIEPIEPVRDSGHVAIITSVDDASRSGAVAHTDGGQSCLPDRYFSISDWGIPVENGADIGHFRSGIVGEFDEADGAGVTALVRHYIYITFGAEARAIIARFQTDIERPDVLEMMAEVMDHGFARGAVTFVEQMACDGPVALWAVAAQPELYRYQTINVVAVKSAFNALPPHLRRHLGPDIAAKFLTIDDKDTADALQAATTRVFREPNAALGLLDARRDLADGAPEAARQKLDDVVTQADDLLPDALIERVEAALAHGEPVPEDVISLVKSVGFEHRGTETGAALARAEIRALASAAHYADAFDRLDGARSDGTANGKVAVDLSREVFALLVNDPSDEAFLSRTIPRLDEATTLPSQLKRDIAVRLLDLGFPAQAREVIGGAGGLPDPEDRLIYAKIALAQYKPQVAVGYLAGLDGEEFIRLRAAAMSMARDHAGAMESYAQIKDEDARTREAWRGGFWDDLASRDGNAFSEAGELMQELDAPPDLPQTPLAMNEALIETSQSTRGTIEALLSATESRIDNSE